ncbi:hypothetical protein DL769_010456 [Monosporascus sp. CRB-8-3]|nr:hypothetical protein DL769_010456 [Monosporascus sp. CRB-8-3]
MRPNNGLNRCNDDQRSNSGLRRVNQTIDHIPTRTWLDSSQGITATHVAYPQLPPPTASSEWRNGSQYSTQSTTDFTFEPSVFDNLSNDEGLGSTQTTVGWDSSQDDEQSSLCEEAYSPTLSESEALEEASSQFASQSQLSDFSSSCNTRDERTPSPTSSTSTTYFSPLLVRSPAVLPGSGARTESNRDLSPTPNRGAAIAFALEDRLELVWRLSKTTPVVVFQEHQISHLENDIKSPIDRVMNDGIGRVSPSVMRKIRDKLGLSDTPCAIQARFGSAKGMWITDVTESGQEDWIETYPKQRKWNCNWSDEYNRTLEVKSWASPRKSANLNLQFLSILEDRAHDKMRMRNAIGKHLAIELERDLGSLKAALKQPELFRQWARESSSSSSSRVHNREVPFFAGLPYNAQDNMCFLADGGFDPMRQKYLRELVFSHQRQKCERVETELRIKIARSTYALMAVDFLGVLEPNEVQLCFSSNFDDGLDQYSDLDGVDVLVARSPAHLPSDIQKVRAVFKPELRRLEDVIIFPRTGDVPLADTLSGGDYDGDMAWVCWEPDIVDNFESKLPPPKPDFSPYLERDEDTLGVLSKRYGEEEYVDAMIEKAFAFNLKPKMLGICTSYKERLAYHRNSIGENSVVALSWFLSELADQAKNGIIFGEQQWARLRNDFVGEKRRLPEPAYKSKVSTQWKEAEHIIDHLRFVVAKGVIESELKSLNDFYETDPAYSFDADLTGYWDQFEKAVGQLDNRGVPRSGWLIALRRNLKSELEECFAMWRKQMAPKNAYRPESVLEVYDHWRDIQPSLDTDGNNKEHCLTEVVAAFLQQPGTHPPELSQWQLLKASLTFREFHTANVKFVWRIAGRQLQFIKALSTGCHGGGPPVPVIPHLYAALKPDNKYIKRVVAREDGGVVSEAAEGPAEGEDVDEFEDLSDLESALADLEGKEVTIKNAMNKKTAVTAFPSLQELVWHSWGPISCYRDFPSPRNT